MAQSLSNILIHLVFSTKNREPFISPTFETSLYKYLNVVCADQGCPSLQINGMPDHVHILLCLSRTKSVSELVSVVKGNSSRWLKEQGFVDRSFAWQGGYGGFSIGESGKAHAIAYIANQKTHHMAMDFQDEYRKLLDAYKIAFNEDYVWD